MRMIVPVVLGSANARVGLPAALEALRTGRSAMDAAIAAIRCVEDNLEDHSVGTGGIPNVLGQVELDASVMDGRTLAAGAVCAVQGYPHPIEIARKVMESTPHVMLAGAGRGEMAIRAVTAYSIVRYMRDGLAIDDALQRAMLDLRDLVDPFAERVNVMNALAMDRCGNVAAVSTAADTFFVFQRLDMA